ncbi:MAG: hypothetical protein ABIO94_10425 [Opitutaceae bacterium]
MPAIATNVTDAAGIQRLAQWMDTFANGYAGPRRTPDHNLVTYAITGGNGNSLFSTNPMTVTLRMNGVLN